MATPARLLDVYELAPPGAGIVQFKHAWPAIEVGSFDLDEAPTEGNVLVVFTAYYNNIDADDAVLTPGTWTAGPFAAGFDATQYGGPGTAVAMGCRYRAVGAGESKTINHDSNVGLTQSVAYFVYEISGIATTATAWSASDTMTAGNEYKIGPVTGSGFLIGGWAHQRTAYAPADSVTPSDGTTELWDKDYIGSTQQDPHVWLAYKIGLGPTVELGGTPVFNPHLNKWGRGAVGLLFEEGGGGGDGPLSYLGTLETAFDVRYRDELDGHGSGQFSIPRYSDPEAGIANTECSIAVLGDGVDVTRLIKVRLLNGSGGYDVVGAFWLETGDFTLLSEQERGAEVLTFGGRGVLSYLDRGIMADHSYLTSPFIGEDPFDRKWRLWAAGTGPEPIAILWRIVTELQENARPSDPVPLLSMDFTYDLDSTSAAVTATDATAEFEAQVGERVLAVAGRLLGTGALIIRMDHTLTLSAYNVANFGTDRTGLAFGAGVVRFVDAVNIRSLSRQIASGRRATHSIVQGDGDTYGHAEVADAATRPHWESFVSSSGTDTAALDAIGAADLAQRVQRSEVVRFPFAAGYTPLSGYYLPWTDVAPGDEVTIHTGDQDRDLDDVDGIVAAISMADRPGAVPLSVADLDFWIEIGSTMSVRDAAGSSIVSGSYGSGGLVTNVGGSGGAHSHPPTIAAADAWKQPVRVATTGPVTIATALNAGDSLDGVTLAEGDRVLVKDQTAGAENGIYVVSATPARAADMAAGELVPGAVVYVRAGTANGGTAWSVTNTGSVTLGSTAITWEELGAGGSLALDDLSDVEAPAPNDGDTIVWNDYLQLWEPAPSSRTFDVGIAFLIDGGGAAITTGIKGDLEIPFDCTIVAARLFADQTGSIVVDVWKDVYANFPPTDADSITASAPPTISSGVKGEDVTLTGWTTAVAAGDILRFNVDSVTDIARVTVALTVERTI